MREHESLNELPAEWPMPKPPKPTRFEVTLAVLMAHHRWTEYQVTVEAGHESMAEHEARKTAMKLYSETGVDVVGFCLLYCLEVD